MAKISLFDIFTGSSTTKWLEADTGVSLEYSEDRHSVIIGLTGTGPGGTIDIGLDPDPTLGGDLNLNGYSIISNAGQDIIIQPGIGGHLILNGLQFPDNDGDAGDLLGTDGNGHLVWYKVPGISNSQAGLTYYVDQSVATTGDGSKEAPFKTINEANIVVDDGDTIVIYAGTYSEDLTVSKSITFLAIDDADVTIFGKMTTALNTSVKATGIKFENNVDEILINNGTVTIDSGSLTREDQNGVTGIGLLILKNTLIKTHISANGPAELYNTDSDGGLVSTYTSLIIHSAIKAPMIDHVGGDVEIRNAPTFDYDDDNSTIGTNNSIRSTSDTGLLLIDNVSFKQVTGWSYINKTGDCDWVINNVGRDAQADVLMGSRAYFVTEASDLSSFYNPTNYNIPNNPLEKRDVREASITSHLVGIDAVLGQAVSSLDNVIWVAENGSNSNTGSYNRPYQTLEYAVTQAQADQTIIVASGSYDGENVIVDKDLKIIGFADATFTDSEIQITNGAMLITDHINVYSSTSAFMVNNGSFKLYNSNFISPDSAINILELSADSEIIDSNWAANLYNSDTSGHKLVIRGINSPQANFIIDGVGSKTYIRDSAVVGHIEHSAGYLSVVNVGQIDADGSGESITDTADNSGNNFLYLNLVSTKQDDGTYGKIEKTGDSPYQLGINDIGSNNTLNGTGDLDSISSDQVHVEYIASSYSSTSVLTDHIEKIDELLGQAIIRPSRLYYVDNVDELNDIYMGITESTFGYDSSIYITPGAIAQFILHDNFEFKPGINLIGTGASENVIVQMPTTIPNLIMESASSGMVHETLWRDIKLNSPTIVNLTLADDEVHFENMTINGDITVNSGKMIIRNSKINGVITIAGGSLELWSCELLENVVIGSGSLYINGVKQYIDNSSASFNISGGNVIIHNIDAANTQNSIFRITGGKTIVTTLITNSSTYNTVINQDVGGSLYLGTNNIVAENKTVSGTVLNLGFGL
ncbi:MAG: DUF1565 domain-containing protein [Gammaproteobacteria bacterium]|nr:DUF1565 domain-containing protein [Gammaproteobacteria bacterium]